MNETSLKTVVGSKAPKIIPDGWRKFPLSSGKYQKTVLGREVTEAEGYKGQPVWAERRQDKDGPYWKIFTLVNY